jgi:hypothetical protein
MAAKGQTGQLLHAAYMYQTACMRQLCTRCMVQATLAHECLQYSIEVNGFAYVKPRHTYSRSYAYSYVSMNNYDCAL